MSLDDAIKSVYSEEGYKAPLTLDNIYEEVLSGVRTIDENGRTTLNEAYEALYVEAYQEPNKPRSIEEAYLKMLDK